jgi:general secretion pathway protein G
MQAKRGFTLVEILIVVVILGILAAIVIPQFTQASSEAKLNSLTSNLQSLRSQVELYKVQHTDMAPGNTRAADGTIAAGGTVLTQLTGTSDIDGASQATKVRAGAYQFGPYLERIPDNPFNGKNTIRTTQTEARTAAGTHGWVLVTTTGDIYADNTGDISTTDTNDFSTL